MIDLRENDLLTLEIAYAHNPDVLLLVRTLRELRDDVAETVRRLEDENDSEISSINAALKCLGSETRWPGEADEAFPT